MVVATAVIGKEIVLVIMLTKRLLHLTVRYLLYCFHGSFMHQLADFCHIYFNISIMLLLCVLLQVRCEHVERAVREIFIHTAGCPQVHRLTLPYQTDRVTAVVHRRASRTVPSQVCLLDY